VQAGAAPGERAEPGGVDEADLVQVGDHRAALIGKREQPLAHPATVAISISRRR
jgi:hypothetical protein